jgi:hypothetical protein
MKRKTAGQFSFLMAIPIMIGAGLYSLPELLAVHNLQNFLPIMVTGFLVAGVVGYLAISWLMKYISNHSLLPFAGYCFLLAAGSLAVLTLNPQITNGNTASAAAKEGSVYQVGFDPDLEWLLPKMSDCQQQLSNVEFVYQPYAALSAATSANVYFSYEPPQNNPDFAYKIGEDHLEIVVNSGNKIDKISKTMADSIFSGRSATWQAVLTNCPDCAPAGTTADGNITVWTLPENSYLSNQFNESFLSSPISSQAKIAPDANTMLQMLSVDPNAIGVLPADWLNASVKALVISDANGVEAPLAIIATTTTEPGSEISPWMACIQKSLSQ